MSTGSELHTADAVVIGGGILGASVGHFLAKSGFGKVVLLEQNRICTGSTAYSAANVRQHYSNEVAVRLALRGLEMFQHAEDELGGPAGFVQCGYLVIAPEDQVDGLRRAVADQQRLGVKTQLLEPSELHARYPQIDLENIALGALERDSGYADPLQTVNALVRSAERWGLRVYEGTPAVDILVDDGAVSGVATPNGRISTSVVVNAAGPWAERVGAMAGVEYNLSLSLEHEVVIGLPEGFGALPIVSDAYERIYFRPQGRTKLLVGEGYPKQQDPCGPDCPDERANPEAVERVLGRLARRVPSLVNPPRVTDYAGIYTITEDWYPIVDGEHGPHGYFAMVGGSGHSFKIGPPLGEALAAVIVGEDPAIDISPLSYERFARKDTFTSVWGPGNRG